MMDCCGLGLNEILHWAADSSKDDFRKVKATVYDGLDNSDESLVPFGFGDWRMNWQNNKVDN